MINLYFELALLFGFINVFWNKWAHKLLLKSNFVISYLSYYLLCYYLHYLSYYTQLFTFRSLEYLMNKYSSQNITLHNLYPCLGITF